MVPVALTIAGSDPSGGAGVQADLRTFAALGVYGLCAVSALIAENSREVRLVEPVGAAMVRAQIDAAVAERRPRALKTGVLGSAQAIEAVARAVRVLRLPAPVVDPVLFASGGAALLPGDAVALLARRLIPLAALVTPNADEARTLSAVEGSSLQAMRRAAREIVRMGARAVVVKGGHFAAGREVVDLFYDGSDFVEFRHARVPGHGAHGTGCAFSAAAAALLARGVELRPAVAQAGRFVQKWLARSFRPGNGRPLMGHLAPAGRVR